ncbi:MAG: PAS domain S-box protein [Solirubrobacterales bacterium]
MDLGTRRSKFDYEHIVTTHIACTFIFLAVVMQNQGFNQNNYYPRFLIYLFGIWSILLLEAGLIYLLNKRGYLTESRFSVAEYLYVGFPVLVSIMILFYFGDHLSYVKAIILLPVIIVGSLKGKFSSYVTGFASTLLLLVYDLIHVEPFDLAQSVADNFLLISIILLVAWFSSTMHDLDQKYQTETKSAAEQLSSSETRLRRITDNMLDMVGVVAPAGCFEYVSPSFYRILGYHPNQLTGQSIYSFIHPQEVSLLEKALNPGSPHLLPERLEIRFQHQDGAYIWLEVISTPLTDADGRVSGTIFGSRDITLRKAIENALAAEKERLSVTLKSIGEAVIATDLSGRVIVFNEMAERLTGFFPSEIIGKPLENILFHVEVPNTSAKELANLFLYASEPQEIPECVLNFPHGGGRIASICGAPIRSADGILEGAVLAIRDITEKKKTEAELLKASKLESLGVLAGGLAHDFNNLMMVVLGNITLIRLQVGNEACSDYLQEIQKAVVQAKRLTQQLLTFARGGAPIKKTLSLTDLLESSLSFSLSGSNVRCVKRFASNLWPVEVDEGQINQVINNLVINAIQAMPNGGTVWITAENMENEPGGGLPQLSNGHYIHVSIQDEGMGIPEEHLPRIFDPYYTTKATGSGLGLATAYSIIRNHNGCISVDSLWRVGTTFHLYLPACTYSVPDQKPDAETIMSGHGRILVMDDDKEVGRTVVKMLRSIGFEADHVLDGRDAIDSYQKSLHSGQAYDLIMLDLTVPGGMGGIETMQHLLRLDPNTLAVISSGYYDEAVMSEFREWGFRGIVPKPYDLKELSDTLSQVLETRDARFVC